MQKVYTKSLTHSLTDEACSHKVFPNGRPTNDSEKVKFDLSTTYHFVFIEEKVNISKGVELDTHTCLPFGYNFRNVGTCISKVPYFHKLGVFPLGELV